jgi:hypothetical protein
MKSEALQPSASGKTHGVRGSGLGEDAFTETLNPK